MDIKQLELALLQASIVATVFGFGLRATREDGLYLLRRPSLLGRSLLAMFIIMPLIAVILARVFDFRHTVEVALVALAISPLPPLMPRKIAKATGETSYAIALMVTAGLLSIIITPVLAELLERLFARSLEVQPASIVRVVAASILLPLAAGLVVRGLLPKIADRLVPVISLVGGILLPVAVIGLVASSLPAIWAQLGNGTLVAIGIFVAAGLVVGQLLAGPDANDRATLAIATSARHPAIAFSIASANYADEHFGAAILLYLLIAAVLGVAYQQWRRRTAASN